MSDSPLLSTPFVHRLDEDWVVYHPLADRLLILNPTAKTVWDLLCRGYAAPEIAAAFAQHFGISVEQAERDVERVLAELTGDDAQDANEPDFWANLPDIVDSGAEPNRLADCGIFRFGYKQIRVRSAIAQLDESLFARFQHRAMGDEGSADVLEDVLEIARCASAHRLTFCGEVIAEVPTISQMLSRLVELLLSLEHPQRPLLAYCHSAALSRAGRSLLMPGRSGAGKSTLTAFLVAHGFDYLGDDTIAIGEDEMALLPLPTRLSIKSGAWPVLEPLYPMLPGLPTLHRYGRSIRYIDPAGNYHSLQAAAAPSAIVFPAYSADEPTRLDRLQPPQTMIRLLGAHARLSSPATEAKLARLIRFVEQTPAYELTYSDLTDAMHAIEGLLANTTNGQSVSPLSSASVSRCGPDCKDPLHMV